MKEKKKNVNLKEELFNYHVYFIAKLLNNPKQIPSSILIKISIHNI